MRDGMQRHDAQSNSEVDEQRCGTTPNTYRVCTKLADFLRICVSLDERPLSEQPDSQASSCPPFAGKVCDCCAVIFVDEPTSSKCSACRSLAAIEWIVSSVHQ